MRARKANRPDMGANKSGGRENGAKPLPAPVCAPPPRPEETSPLETVARLNATLDALPDLLFVLDRAGRIIDYHAPNPERLFVPPDQFLGRTMDDVLPEPARGIVNRAIADALARGQHRGSRYPLPAPDGERWFEISIAAQGDPRAPDGRLVAIVRDVTDRQRTEDALREREQTYRMLTEGMQDVIWILDVEARRFTYVSPSVEKLRGYTPEEILARPLEDAWAPEEHEKLEQFVRQSVAAFQAGQITTETYVTYEMLQPCKDGSVVTSEVVARLMRNERTGRLEAHGVTRDISKRVQAEAALRESEDRFAQLARQSRTIVFEMDADGRCTFVSPEVADVLGYRPEDVVGKLFFYDLFSPGDRETFKAAAFDVFRKNAPLLDFENPCVTRDGRKIWVTTNALPLLDPDGTLRGYRGSVRDVTDRKRAEDALRESEARFAQTARQSRAFVWEVDADGLYMFITPVVEDVLGYRPDEIAGQMHFYDLHPVEGREAFRAAAIEVVRRHGEFRDYENPMVAKDGRTRWVSTNAIPLLDADGALLGYRGIDFDVTERKRAEETLRESEARFAAATQASRSYVWEVAPDGLYVHVGAMVAEVLGYRPEEMVGRLHFYDLLPPEGREELKRHCFGIMARRESPSGFENVNVAKDGRLVWLSSSARPLFNADGSYRGYQGIDTDISARKQAQDALRESELQLRALNDNLPGGLVYQMDTGVDGRERRLLAVSKGVERMHGVTAEEALSHQKTFYLQIVPEDQARVAELEARAIATLTPFRAEVRCRMPTGEIRWIYVSSAPRRLPNGHLVWDGIEIDVTDRKLAEEALRESEARFAASTQASRSYVWQVDPEGLITYVSPMVEEVLGRRPEEIAGRLHFYDLLPKDNREEIKIFGLALMARREAISGFENRNVAQDGRLVWISSSANPLFGPDGTFLGYQGIDTDITERKRAEEALRLSETKYRQLHETMRDAFATADMRGRIQDFNPAFRKLTGYSAAELRKMNYRRLTPRKWQVLEAQILEKQVLARGYSDVYEKEYRRKDGTLVPVELRTILIRDDADRPAGMWASIRGIAGRKRAESALRQSEAKYRLLFENMGDSFAALDLQGRLIDCNPAFEKLVGYSRKELLRLHLADITPKEWMVVEQKAVAQMRRRGYSNPFEKEYVRKDGTRVPVELQGSLIRDARGRPTGLWAIIRDVSDRKRAEQALREAHDKLERRVRERTAELVASQQALVESEEQFRQMAENVQDAFWLIDARTQNVLYVSPAFKRIWKRPVDKDTARWFAHIHPQDRDRVVQAFQKGMKNGVSATVTYRLLWPDGSIRWIESSGSMIRDGRGRPIRAAGLIRDVTERRRLEEKILQAAEAERQRIGRDLHDSLGQSLTAIGYLADAVREDLARRRQPEAAAVRKLGRLIEKAADQSHALAQGLLLADLRRGGLGAALQELAFRTQELFGIACRYAGPASVPPLDASVAGQLYRIAQEAVTNAAKHAQAQRIDVRLAKNRGNLLLSVRDSGKGIPAKKKKNAGLGLDIMRYRAGMIGATLEIESARNQGTAVNCRLPLAAPAPKRKK